MKKLIIIVFTLFFVSCSTMYQERVVLRMNDLSERPKWASMEKVMFEKEGIIYVVGISTGPYDSRISGLAKIADNNARYEITRFIQSEMGYIFLNVQEGVVDGASLSHFYGTELSKLMVNKIKTESRYFEKVMTAVGEGEKKIRTDLYSLVSIKKITLEKLVRKAVNDQKEISQQLKKTVTDHLSNKINLL